MSNTTNEQDWILLNGKPMRNENLLTASNRSFRYGDGFFESIRVMNGKIPLLKYHLQRIARNQELLRMKPESELTGDSLLASVESLLNKNSTGKNARLRLVFFRNEGNDFNSLTNSCSWILQSYKLNEKKWEWNENGLSIGIFPDARKAPGRFSQVKSNSMLSNIMASIWAKENKLNEAILLNSDERVCESIHANIFLVEKTSAKIFTPPLSEACVDGVMRKFILDNTTVVEKKLSVADLENAAEIFLSNAVKGIRWVGTFQKRKFGSEKVKEIFALLPQYTV